MKSMVTFHDKDLQNVNGPYADYHTNGYLATSGQFINNKKEGVWYEYNDSAKAITEFKFHSDSLISKTDIDSLNKTNKNKTKDTTGEIEAVYKGGIKKLQSIIISNFKVPDRTTALNVKGTVAVRFVINISGRPVDIAVLHSVEFAFDEEAMRVITYLKDWIPASEKGRKVNAYRIQPITYMGSN